MGTTRMAADPRKGVVDADCKVHGISNLYVAGSSVFTTSSTVNPTLTIIALALRLAEHAQQKFVRGV
jgi:choline dehydrogenase-like flavoprotein